MLNDSWRSNHEGTHLVAFNTMAGSKASIYLTDTPYLVQVKASIYLTDTPYLVQVGIQKGSVVIQNGTACLFELAVRFVVHRKALE